MNILVKKIMVIIAILTICVSFAGCAYLPPANAGPSQIRVEDLAAGNYIFINSDGQFFQGNLVAKDFVTLGLIFLESTATFDRNGYIVEGTKITYEMLMREAEKLGADDIINLRIDEIETLIATGETRRDPSLFRDVNIFERTIVYKANALAIKYTVRQ